MKDSVHKKAPTHKKSARPTKSNPTPGYLIKMSFGGAPPKQFSAKDLDHEALSDYAEMAGGKKLAGKPITLTIDGIDEWPVAIASNAFNLWKVLVGEANRAVKLRHAGQEYDGPADLAGTILVSKLASTDATSRALDLAAEALLAVSCKPADLGISIDNVIEQVRKVGITSERCKSLREALKKRLKGSGPPSSEQNGGGEGINAVTLAKLFLANRYGAGTQGEDDDESPRRLRYYEETFYRRGEGCWCKATVEDMRLELTSYLQEVAPGVTSQRRIGDVLVNVKALCALSVDTTPPPPFHLEDPKRVMMAFENGLLDLTALGKGKPPRLLPHDPNWFSTSVLPYEYDPKAKCPEFKKFLGQILDADPNTLEPNKKGDNRVKGVQEMMGYCLLTDNRFQKFFVLLGDGGNGKGTLLHVLSNLIGAENISSVTLEGMGKEFGQESMIGKMLNISGDMNEIDNAKEGTLKTWTGEDLVTVYRKYREPIQVEPTLKFIYATNALPWFKDRTNGTWRRMVAIPFNYAVKAGENDPHLRRKLCKELPGILNWALKGLARLLKQGHFTPCEVCAAAAEKHREDCSPVRQFVKDHFTFASEYQGKATGLKWMTDTNAIKLLVKEHNDKYGDRSLKAHIVCREVAGMPGVFCERPTKYEARKQQGSLLYFGVCIGDPKQVIPGDEDEIEEKTGVEPPPYFGAKKQNAGEEPSAKDKEEAGKGKKKAKDKKKAGKK